MPSAPAARPACRQHRQAGHLAMTTLAIDGGRVLVDSSWVDGTVEIEGTRIASVGRRTVDASVQTVDASGCSIVPGFIDLQVNGAVGADLTSEPTRVGEV